MEARWRMEHEDEESRVRPRLKQKTIKISGGNKCLSHRDSGTKTSVTVSSSLHLSGIICLGSGRSVNKVTKQELT